MGTGIDGLDFYQIEVGENGSIIWNDEEVSLARVRRLLDVNAQLQPPVPVVLRTTSRSRCDMAERIRTTMDTLPMCREGICFESARWEALGLPSFESYYRPDGSRR